MKRAFLGTLKFISAMLLAIMSILVILNVIMRYVFHSSIIGTESIARLMFIWMSFLAASFVIVLDEHLKVDALLNKLREPGKSVLLICSHAVIIFIMALFTYGVWQQILLNNDIMAMGAIPYPISWTYMAGLVLAVICLLYSILSIVKLVMGLAHGTPGS